MFVQRFMLAAALATTLTTAARADGPDGTFVGPVQCGEKTARLGLVTDSDSYLAYVCSQDEGFNRDNARWFKGIITGGKLEGKSADGQTLTGVIKGDAIEGEVKAPAGSMTFRVTRVDPQASLAGLYRAEEKDGANDYVAGWVVDADENVAGAVQNRQNQRVVTPKPPAPGTGGAANLSPRPGVQGQPVQSPKTPPQGKKGSKFTQEDQDEKIRNIEANLGGQGGSPLLAAVVQQVKRFNSGARPVGAIEQQTFAKLSKAPKALLTQYIQNWDKLPAKTRQAALGAAGSQLQPNQPLTPELVRSVIRPKAGSASPASAGAQGVKSVRLTTIKCVNKTGELSKDDIFVTYLVTSGTAAFDQTTSIYEFRSGDEQFVKAADAQVWPPAGTAQTAAGDVFIGAGVFDDDSADKARVLSLVKTLIDVAATVLVAAGQPEIAAFGPAADQLFEGIVAALPDTQFLGSDSLQVKPTKQAIGPDGQAKSILAVQKTRKNGKIKFRYEILGLQIN